MATGGLLTFRDNAVYMSAGKQAAWNTDVAPTWTYLWLDGSSADPQSKITKEREGDGSGFNVLAYKESQYEVVKIVEYARPMLAGYALQSLLGSGSDAYTAPTVNTTFVAIVAAGAANCQVAANLGSTGTVAVIASAGYSSAAQEPVTLDLTTKSGTGPYTYTLAAGATFAKGHASGDAVVSAAGHVLTPKYAYDPYTFEVGYGEAGALSQIVRFIDGCCVDLTIDSQKGKPVKFTHTWYCTRVKYMTASVAPTYPTGSPFRHFDASGSWRLNNLATGNAATIETLQLQLKRSVQAMDCQSEGLTAVQFLPGNLDCDGSLSAIFNGWADYNLAYFGATAPTNGTLDAILVGEAQLGMTYQSDVVNSLALALPTIDYESANVKQSLKGGAIKQPIKFFVRKTAAAPIPFTATLMNTQLSAY